MALTSRQRLLRCLNRQPVDRVPVSTYELAGWDFDQWQNKEPSYAPLMEAVRQKADCILMYWPDFIYTEEQKEHAQYPEGGRTATRTVWHTRAGDFTRVTAERPEVKTVWHLEHYLKNEEDVERFLQVPLEVPGLAMDRFFEKQAALGENGIMTLEFGDPLCEAAELMGMEPILTLLLTERKLAEQLLEKLFENIVARLELVLRHDVRDVMFRIYGAEYCTPPYFSPKAFPWVETQYLTPMCEKINRAGGYSRIHSHGKVRSIMDEVVKTGAMVVDPLEPPPDGDLPLAEAKALYGDKLILMGNLELKDLEAKEPEEIRALVRAAMRDGAPGGGFILLPSSTPINVPLDARACRNLIAMLDAGREFGAL